VRAGMHAGQHCLDLPPRCRVPRGSSIGRGGVARRMVLGDGMSTSASAREGGVRQRLAEAKAGRGVSRWCQQRRFRGFRTCRSTSARRR